MSKEKKIEVVSNEVVKLMEPGLRIRSKSFVRRQLIDQAMIISVCRNDKGNDAIFLIGSAILGIVLCDVANFRSRFKDYVIDGGPLDGEHLAALIPMSNADQADANDLEAAV